MSSKLRSRTLKSACLVGASFVPGRFGNGSCYAGVGDVKRHSGESVAKLAEYSHGKREVLSSSPSRATIFPHL